MAVRILLGDVREKLRELPERYFHSAVFSPPYWGLRDYDVPGQIGLEPTLGEHLEVMVDVCREIWRVLRDDGTVWLNYGDCYAAAPNGKSAAAYKADGTDDRTFRDKPFSTVGPIYSPNHHGDLGARGNVHRRASGVTSPGAIVAGGFLKPKDLCMIPNRLAIALQDDGWFIRSEIIWHKPNPMPESVYDRPTTAHEKIWLLSKSEDYFYDHEAIREPVTGGAHARAKARGTDTGVGWGHQDKVNPREAERGRGRIKVAGVSPKSAPEDERFVKANARFHSTTTQLVETRNARNVWTIAPRPFREAHFATFPPALAERCILAGTPPLVCGCCGAPAGCGPLCASFARVPGRVLDPFGGSGTVGMVAQQLGRDATLIELKPEYAVMAERRVAQAMASMPTDTEAA